MPAFGPKAKWNARRTLFLAISAAAFVVTEIGRHRLRPMFRESGFDDFGITNSIGNTGGILVQIFLCLSIINPRQRPSYLWATFFSAGYIVYEFLQPILPKGVFDWNDVTGTLVGYVIALPIIYLIWKLTGADTAPDD